MERAALATPQEPRKDMRPAALRLEGVSKRYGRVLAVDDVSLAIAEGEFFTLLGPSGSGKTTLLRLIAGFERPDAGRIELGGKDVTAVPPYARATNTVFQDYALFPHMTVAANVEYGLKVRHLPRDERRRRVAEGLTMGDRVAVLNGGRIEQLGSPVDLYEHPANEFVAGFIGVSNLIDRDGRRLVVRPERIRLLRLDETPEPGSHLEDGVVQDVTYAGMVTRYAVQLDRGGRLLVVQQNMESAARATDVRGRRVRLAWRPEQAFNISAAQSEG